MNLQLAAEALQKYFGYDAFRPLQSEVIQSVYDNKDALVIMPTGGGKSMCFQLPAITMPGTCVVISPLISLMQDQVTGLRANGVKAAFLNSSLGLTEQTHVEQAFLNGDLDLLYVSPEKLLSGYFPQQLKSAKINLFAIDEAHCISSWGHDFRPEYTRLSFLKEQFPDIPVLALTATADRLTQKDIVKLLQLKEPESYIASFDRPNIELTVKPGQKRLQQIEKFIDEHPGESGIIYCLSRKSTEKVAASLQAKGINAAAYHAGMPSNERRDIQQAFIEDRIPIICATIAFGMGIDKSNVRWVIHYNMPKNIEGYYQEIGRSGRDGAKAEAVLFYSYGDVMTLTDIIQKNESENEDIQLAKLARMQQFAEALACRRRILLNYFNEDRPENCGNCDMCKNPPSAFDGTIIAQKALSATYRLNQKVGAQLLIDVLRGSGKQVIFQRKFNEIKTYGAGRMYSIPQWKNYITQLINLGYLEIAHDESNVLKLTPASRRVLFSDEKVELVELQTIKDKQAADKKAKVPTKERHRERNEMFEILRVLRRDIAQEKGIPPYLVFSDKTLEEMAATYPTTEEEFRTVSGVGDKKVRDFGEAFISAIQEYAKVHPDIVEEAKAIKARMTKIVSPVKKTTKTKASTFDKTLELLQKNLSPEEIAMDRGLAVSTVHSHIWRLFGQGKITDLSPYVNEEEIEMVRNVLPEEELEGLKPLYEQLGEKISYFKIRVAIALMREAGGV